MSTEIFDVADDLGPRQIVHLYEPSVDLRAIVVVDNVACGPAIGGARMAPDVSLQECRRLARAMSLKNAAAGLPHGGGKSVIFADPRAPAPEKERLIRAFAQLLGDIRDYIVGPDMGTDELAMAWIRDEIGRSVGLPRELGGIPLDEIGATGFGLRAAAVVAQQFTDVKLKGARVAIQGFGAVGQHAARFLAEEGSILVAAADSKATLVDPAGLDVGDLISMKKEGRSLRDHGSGKVLDPAAIVAVDCDIWVPAARPDVLTRSNVDQLKARLVLEGANIPATLEAEQRLFERGVLIVPDFIANAGGVICAAVEYRGGSESDAFRSIEEKVTRNTTEVLERAKARKIRPREAAESLARDRLALAMRTRRWHDG